MWTKVIWHTWQHETGATVEFAKGGWGERRLRASCRPYAIRIGDDLLRTVSGAVRTFGDADSAKRVVERLV